MSAPAYTLAQLLTRQNLDAIRARLLAGFQGAGFPAITEWAPKGGVEMGFVTMVGTSVAELLAADAPDIIAGGFLGKATGEWMDLHTETRYQLERTRATKTTFNMDLVVAETVSSPYTWAVDDVEIIAPSGNRYRNTTAGVGAPGGFATLAFEAEAVGSSYNDDPSAVTALVTTFAGVTLRPAAPAFSAVEQTGTSTGQVTPSGQADAHGYVVRIDVTGDVGVARYSVQVDGGEWASGGVLQRSTTPGFGLTLTATNGSSSPASFVAGDRFTFSAPGGPGYVPGSDDESNAALARRCRLRFPSLSANGTEGLYQLWALHVCPTASRVQVTPDLPSDPTAIPGRVRMWVGDSHGPMDPAGLTKINAYVGPKLSALDSFLASAARARSIATLGTVVVTGPTMIAVQKAAEIAWAAYLGAVPIGGQVDMSRLEQTIMDAGAVDVFDLKLNGDVHDVQLEPGELPISAATLIASMEWQV